MRIGILTWFRNTNYGGVLQGLAIGHFLQRMGYRIEFINYSPMQSIPWSQFGLTRFVPVSIRQAKFAAWNWLSLFFPRLQRAESAIRVRRSADFVRHYFKGVIGNELNTKDSLDSEVRKYDLILVGSDQIWNPEWIQDGAYLLEGIGGSVRKISYAASVGCVEISAALHHMYVSALNDYSAVSVRESSAKRALERIPAMRKDLMWVVDPTLLLTAEEWQQMLGSTRREKRRKTLVCYWLADKGELFDGLKTLHNQLDCDIHLYMNAYNQLPKCYYRHGFSWLKIRKTANAKEFIRDLSDAHYVLSDSFHAMMFSVIFQRNIRIAITRGRESMASRIFDFCDKIHMGNCICNGITSRMYDSGVTTWDKKALEMWIKESRDWLLGSLGNVKE